MFTNPTGGVGVLPVPKPLGLITTSSNGEFPVLIPLPLHFGHSFNPVGDLTLPVSLQCVHGVLLILHFCRCKCLMIPASKSLLSLAALFKCGTIAYKGDFFKILLPKRLTNFPGIWKTGNPFSP